MSHPPAGLAHTVSSRALHWLHANRHHGALSDLPDADLSADRGAYKALGETALAASLVLRGGAAGTTELSLARELLAYCWEQAGEGSLLYERLLRYPLKTDPLETYAHFNRGGLRHEELDELLAHTATLTSTHASEHVPNRRLGVANALRVSGLDHGAGAPDWPTLTRATWLGHTPDPWHIDWLTAYAVTHTVYHLTDWGRLPTGVPDDLTDYLRRWLPVWTDIWSEAGHWDLMAELMIVDMCLPGSHVDPADWQRLAEVQHEDGMVPRDDQPVDDDPAQRFDDHQHPTIVAVIAGNLALTRALENPQPA
ncbi:DUF6895 family protein [Streptomyces sp. NPDC102406]|uniref:DUF6895 family protein n=1 Tax=Streptomyces sp. NPDC102406 TaxID=3366171 RepID=UPI00381DC373